MTKYSLKPLNDFAWILSVSGERHALVSQQKDGSLMLTGKINKVFKNMAELCASYPKIIMEEPHVQETDKEQGQIEGYPIRHSTWYNVDKDPTPNYTRIEKSQIRYAAGYFALKMPNGWSASFCPKLSTLAEYEFLGPFTTKMEMQTQISSKNKQMQMVHSL